MSIMKAKKKAEVNLLDLIPRRKVEFTVDDQDIVTIVIPRFKKEWLRRLLVPKRKKPIVNIALDQFGSRVWRQCDGATSVGMIADQLHADFGESVEPVYERVGVFVKQLLVHGFIALDPQAQVENINGTD